MSNPTDDFLAAFHRQLDGMDFGDIDPAWFKWAQSDVVDSVYAHEADDVHALWRCVEAALREAFPERYEGWRSWKDDPPVPNADVLVMEGGGQVYRSNCPQHEDNEFLEWWKPFGPEPKGVT